MDFILEHKLILNGIRDATMDALKDRLTMPNPKYQEAEKMGRWTNNIAPMLRFYDETDQGLECPRGFAYQAYRLCKKHGEQIRVVDNRRTLPAADFRFYGELRDYQAPAVESCLERDLCLLSAPTGSGKTCMALYLIAQRQQPTLIVVHTSNLREQWVERIETFLGIPGDEVGIIGGGKCDIRPVTVATVQSLVKCAAEVSQHFGHLLVDEAHHIPAIQMARAIETFDCRFMTGLSATPYRRDGLSKVIFWHIGDVAGRVDKSELLDNGSLCPAQVHWIETEFSTVTDASDQYSKVLSELAEDEARNHLICKTVADNNGAGISLILSDRKAHCETLAKILEEEHGIKPAVLTGSTGAKDRKHIIKELQTGRCRYLAATGQLIGEGFDLPAISSMFLTTPVKYRGRLIQYIGRALRPAPGKNKSHIFDFVDVRNPVFRAQARSRVYTYQR